MTQKEESCSQGKNIDDWGDYIFKHLKKQYESIQNDSGETWFLYGNGAFHLLSFIDPLYGFIIEYATEATEEAMGMAEDGDQYPLLDYETPEDMLRDMIKEIES